ncbi:hypothetical protein [Cryobacterium sp. MLB-32]|uniref:hypothetical protein n=1 Tax=Cryobacterium sp. MLB-32 TaxID=1529318 RepID=UPI0012E096E9|nr:hypothetical protein [Cryobacterium sp. MLB-32]
MSESFEFRVRSRVAGMSMWRLALSALFFAAVAVVGGISGSVMILVSGVLFENSWLVAFWGAASASLILSFLTVFLLGKQMKREFAAGYTTSWLGYPNLEQVDERTGLIVRAAGEPLISRQEHRTRVQALRASRVDL